MKVWIVEGRAVVEVFSSRKNAFAAVSAAAAEGGFGEFVFSEQSEGVWVGSSEGQFKVWVSKKEVQ